MPCQYLEVAYLSHDGLYIRVVGLGNMSLAASMRNFIEAELGKGRNQCAIDLSRCHGLDSTFMGMILVLSNMLEAEKGQLCLMNAGEDNTKRLDLIGVLEFVPVRENVPNESDIEVLRLEPVDDGRQRANAAIDAHGLLIQINERNRSIYGSFINAMKMEMAQAAAARKPDNPPPDVIVAPNAERPAGTPSAGGAPARDHEDTLPGDGQAFRHSDDRPVMT